MTRHSDKSVPLRPLARAAMAFFLLTCCCVSTKAQTFFVNGEEVDATTYQAHKLMNSAVKEIKENHTQLAIADLQRALELKPTLSEAHNLLGVALARAGKTKQAIEQLRMAIVDDSTAVWPRLNLAALYQTDGNLSDALQIYREFLKVIPDAKQAAAIEERAKLLGAEVDRESSARRHDDNSYDTSSYFGNISDGGIRRWSDSSMPLRVFISPGDGLDGYKPQYEQILKQSFNEWSSATDGKLRFVFIDSPVREQIDCRWVDDPRALESSAEGGEAQVSSIGHAITRAHMLLSLNDSGSPFPLTDNLVHVLCLHEIGHALGLIGHSGRPSDVMYCTAPVVDKEQHLSERDKQTINVLYRQPLDPVSMILADVDAGTLSKDERTAALVLAAAVVFSVGGLIVRLIVLTSRRKKKTNKKKPRT